MAGRIIWAVAFALLWAGCTSGATDPEPQTIVPADPGRLVILDESGNVVVMDPDGSNRSVITDDAGPQSAGYTQPIWSPDSSQLAWGQVTADGFAVGIRDLADGASTTVPTDNLPYYMYWSPDGATLGVLHNGSSGVVFRMVDVDAGTSEVLDEDAPFYFTWSPAGDRVITHAGAERVESLDVEGRRESLAPTGPQYLAPQWTERGVFHVVNSELIVEDEGSRVPVAVVSGFTNFVASDTGDRVALQSGGTGGAIEVALAATPAVDAGDLVVIDIAGDDVETVTENQAAGFFWSPDGSSLLVFAIRDDELTPLVWSGGEVTEFPSYRPPATMIRDTLPFFPQYAQSVQFWSPDSTRFAFTGEIDGQSGVWVQDVSGETPTRVSDGVWVAWSGPGG